MNVKTLEGKAKEIRRTIIKTLSEKPSGHTGGSLGMTDVFTVLYYDFLKVNPKKPHSKDRDYLVLSNGHICPVLYVVMSKKGFFPEKELSTLRKTNSRLQGHPHRTVLPGLETTSGPLGSGLSQASGMALGLKRDKKNNRVVCLTSDGEHEEGNTWEAVLFAAKYKLNNLIQIIDRNKIQIDGYTEDVMPLGSLAKKYKSFDWEVIEINGNDINEVKDALKEADKEKNKPVVIIANTTPGKGVSFMENKYEWHGRVPNEEETKKALEELK